MKRFLIWIFMLFLMAVAPFAHAQDQTTINSVMQECASVIKEINESI